MKKLLVLLTFLVIATSVNAVKDTFTIGVGYGGANELTMSVESPGDFDYSLYLRTAENSPTSVIARYEGLNNFTRSIRLHCTQDEVNASDNPTNGTCVASSNPFVRGVFIAGNTNRFASVKRFTLFCGTIQIVGEESTNTWNTDFNNSAVKNFLDNGPSSTWCPAPQPTPSPTVVLVKKSKSSQTPTKTPRLNGEARSGGAATPSEVNEEEMVEDPTPTKIISAVSSDEGKQKGQSFPILPTLSIVSGLGILGFLGYTNRTALKGFITSFKKNEQSRVEGGELGEDIINT